MKTLIQTVVAVCGLFCGACVPSIHPLYTDADAVFDPSLIGVWMDQEGGENWDFSAADANEYKLVHTDESGKKGEFEARLVMIDGRTFLDIAPVGPAIPQNDFYAGHFLTVHSFVQLQRSGADLRISFLDPKWLKSHLEQNPGALRYAIVDGDVLITDSSKNLQKFLSTNLLVPGAFSEPVSVKRKASRR